MKTVKRWKFLRTGMKSNRGDVKWKKGVWKHEDTLDMCHAGFHCSKHINQAFSFVHGEILAQVEVKGKHLIESDKECYTDMRIVKVWKWTKKDSVSLAVYAAQLVLPIFEKEYPNDDRPRKAIEAAVYWLKHPNKKAARDAWAAAGDAWAAGATAEAARAAAWDAAGAAWAAAGDAAEAARVAAWDAAGAAWAAFKQKIETWLIKRVKVMKEL